MNAQGAADAVTRQGPEREFGRWLAGFGIVFAAAYFGTALARLFYPYPLELMESGMVEHVERLLAGTPLYAEPSRDFVAYIYAPVYYYVSAAVAEWAGLGYAALRLVSFAASIGILWILYRTARLATRSKAAGFVASGFYAATYAICGAWSDLARVDSLFLFFLLASVVLLREGRAFAASAAAGLLAALAAWTKQSALIYLLPAALWLAWTQKKRFAFFASGFVLVTVPAFIAFDRHTGGWSWFYIFEIEKHHSLSTLISTRVYQFWLYDLCRAVPGLLVFSGLYFWSLLREKCGREALAFDCAAASGFFGAAFLGRLNSGSFSNQLMPLYALLSLWGAIGLFRAAGDRAGLAGVSTRRFLRVLALLQFCVLLYWPGNYIPTERHRASWERWQEAFSSLGGKGFAHVDGYWAASVGQETCAQNIAIWDVLRGGEDAVVNRLTEDLVSAVREGRYDWIAVERTARENYVMDLPIVPAAVRYYEALEAALAERYTRSGGISETEPAFWIYEFPAREVTIYTNKAPEAAQAGR